MVAGSIRTTEEARRFVTRGVEREIASLRVLDRRRRAREIGTFAALFVLGAVASTAGATAADSWAGVVAYAAGIVACALAINAFVLLLHEGMHGTLFSSALANRWASVAFGGVVLMSFTAYRVMHTRHHAFLGDERDPDDYHNYTGRRWLVWSLHYVRLVVGTFLYIVLIPAFALRHATRAERREILAEYAILLPAWALALAVLPSGVLVHAWGIPVLVVAYLTSARGFTQHGMTEASDPFLASRSIRSPKLVAHLLLNENFHLEHHLFPEIPSYNLDRLHALLAERIPYRVTGRSYAIFLLRFARATLSLDERPIGFTSSPRAPEAPPARAACIAPRSD